MEFTLAFGPKPEFSFSFKFLLPLLTNSFTKFFYFECMFSLYQYSDFSTIQKQLQIIFSKTIDLQVT